MTEFVNVERMTTYYQEFHHKCVTWYITIIGIFIAGVIAAPSTAPSATAKAFGVTLIIISLACSALFYACIGHFGARINYLTNLLESDQQTLPTNWRSEHKNVSWEIHGIGSVFFVAVMAGMQIALILLVVLRYWS